MQWPDKTADGREIVVVEGDPFDGSGDLPRTLFLDIDRSPGLVHILTTRNPERSLSMWPERFTCEDCNSARVHEDSGTHCRDCGSVTSSSKRPNVWILIECHTQAELNAAAGHLAAMEKLCGVVGLWLVPSERMDLDAAFPGGLACGKGSYICGPGWLAISGGENPTHPDWIRDPIQQAEAAGVPVWFGGWGSWLPACEMPDGDERRKTIGVYINYLGEVWAEGAVAVGMSSYRTCKVGSAHSGCTLDGRKWQQLSEGGA